MTTADTFGTDTREDLDRDLKRSDIATFVIAWMLRRKGRQNDKPIATLILPTIVRPPGSNYRDYGDPGDLFVASYLPKDPMPTAWTRIEVSRRGETFTGLGDYPFPDLIVGTTARLGPATPPPWPCYYLVSQDLRAYARIKRSTRKAWYKRPIHDTRRPADQPRESWCVKAEKVEWGTVPIEWFDDLAVDLWRMCGLEGLE